MSLHWTIFHLNDTCLWQWELDLGRGELNSRFSVTVFKKWFATEYCCCEEGGFTLVGIEKWTVWRYCLCSLVHVASTELLICNTSSENKLPEEGMPNLKVLSMKMLQVYSWGFRPNSSVYIYISYTILWAKFPMHTYRQKAFKNNKVPSAGWGRRRQLLPPVRIVTIFICNGNNVLIFSGKNGNTKNEPKQQIKQSTFWRFCEGTNLPSLFLWRYSWCFGKIPSVCGVI